MSVNEKRVFWVFLVVFIVLAKPAMNYWLKYSLKAERVKWQTCNVYGPTLKPRPTQEWCERQKRIEAALAAEAAKNPHPSLNEIFK